MLYIKTFIFNPISVNTYVLYDDTRKAVIIDPGNYVESENQQLQTFVEKEKLSIKYILNTHPHVDHILGNDYCKHSFSVPLLMHEAGLSIYKHAVHYCVAFGIDFDRFPAADRYYAQDEEIRFGNHRLQVLYTPGHTDGSVSFFEPEEKILFTGDLLFKGSIGRTDLPTGDYGTALCSIKEKILPLPEETVLYPGHGPTSTLQIEKLTNSYLLENYDDKQ